MDDIHSGDGARQPEIRRFFPADAANWLYCPRCDELDITLLEGKGALTLLDDSAPLPPAFLALLLRLRGVRRFPGEIGFGVTAPVTASATE